MFILVAQRLSGREMSDVFSEAAIKMQALISKHSAPFIAKIYQDGNVKLWKNDEDLLTELEDFIKLSKSRT
jgi:hypothetical protein